MSVACFSKPQHTALAQVLDGRQTGKCQPDTDREVLGQYQERFGEVHSREVDEVAVPNRF